MEDGERSLLPPRERASRKRRGQRRRRGKKEKTKGKGRKKLSPSLGGPRERAEKEERAEDDSSGRKARVISKILPSKTTREFPSRFHEFSSRFSAWTTGTGWLESRNRRGEGMFVDGEYRAGLTIFKYCRVECVGSSNAQEGRR